MTGDDTTFGFNAEKLARLWAIGAQDDEPDTVGRTDQAKLELLLEGLAEKVPLDKDLTQTLSPAFVQLCGVLKPFVGHSYQALLNNPDTDVATFRRIKDLNKASATQAHAQGRREVLAVLYYAAIAGALVYHRQCISSLSFQHLSDRYRTYLEFAWLTPDIRILFEQALACCTAQIEQTK